MNEDTLQEIERQLYRLAELAKEQQQVWDKKELLLTERIHELTRANLLQQDISDKLAMTNTALKQAKLRLKHEQRLLLALLDTIPDPIYFKDPDGVYLGCNETFASRYVGLPKAEIIGKDDFTIIPDQEHAATFQRQDRAVLAAGIPLAFVEAFTMSDGRRVILDTIKTPFLDKAGQILGVIGVGRDVTVRREIEQALTLSRTHMQIVLNNLPMLAWLKDKGGRFLMVNRLFAEAAGRPGEEILGLTDADLWPQALAEYYRAVDEEIMTTGLGKHSEEPGNTDNSTWFETFKAPITAGDGTIIGTTGIALDITGRKQAEELILEQQRELQTLNDVLEQRINGKITKIRAKDLLIIRQDKMATLGLLAAGVAHEINNPLSYVASNIRVLTDYLRQMGEYLVLQQELLERTVAPEEQRQELAVAAQRLEIPQILDDGPALVAESLEGVERVSLIVRNLKGFSHMDAQEVEPAELTACLESALLIVQNELKYVATIVKEYQELPRILCRPAQLSQVFLNLLTNAGHAVASPGQITLKSRHDEGFVYVSVADNGHGIPEELRERIFEPFFTTKEIDRGTGLGLSISRDIITRHHGEILVESSAGVGTIFTVKLPRTAETS